MDPSTISNLRTQPSLLRRLHKWDDAKSWQEFDQIYRRLVFGFACNSGLTREEAEEVTQDVFTEVAQKIGEFESNPERGTFRGWLMTLTRWRVTDKFRRRQAEAKHKSEQIPDSGSATAEIERIPADSVFEAQWFKEWRGNILEAAMTRLARRVKPNHFQVFELYARQRWPVMKIAKELDLSAPMVYLISHRLTKQLRAEVALLEKVLV